MSRRAGREMALRALFQVDLVQVSAEIALSSVEEDFPEVARGFARRLLLGTLEHLHGIDVALDEMARQWRVGRMPATDRNVLRLAAYEILYCDDIPVGAAINEAVELAKAYGTESSGRFVNGVLASLALKKDKPDPLSN